ncbi:hypothetical protein NWFMUON74_71390 [Nocardia wallacei]|uniref:Uncharacterized protein n=1 Tax=Nocardia wallacei TaxID=480035 RepID=A0A7G1KW08_9NOCA|nr:hypothetical protein NWFMUON74_71390 [Nocardia wallacei]
MHTATMQGYTARRNSTHTAATQGNNARGNSAQAAAVRSCTVPCDVLWRKHVLRPGHPVPGHG